MNNENLLINDGKILEKELLSLLDAEVEKSSIDIDADYISSITYILDKLRGSDFVPKEYSLENFVERFNSKYGTHLKSDLSDTSKVIRKLVVIGAFLVITLSVIFNLYRFLVILINKCPLRL